MVYLGGLHYASGMRIPALLVVLLLSQSASAVICKTVDAEGVVGYSDVPASECANKVKLPPSSTYTPRPLPATIRPNKPSAESSHDFSGYTKASFVQPEDGGTERSQLGKVAVSVELEPPLQPGHKMRLQLDGVKIQPSFNSQSASLTGVERGTHSLAAEVLDEGGVVLISVAPIQFTLRKDAIESSVGDEPNPDPGYNAPSSGNFSSGASGSAGAAFAPSYSP